LDRTEDAQGCEVYLATRGDVTIPFHSVAEVDAWLEQQPALAQGVR
jgi:hypothetical protein